MSKTHKELGQIMLDNYTIDEIENGYDIEFPHHNLELVGGTALLFGDISEDGTLN